MTGVAFHFIIDRGDALLPTPVATQSQSQNRAIEGRLDGLEQGVQDLLYII